MRAVWILALVMGCGGAASDEVTNDETSVDSGASDTGGGDTGSTDSGATDSGGGDSGTTTLVGPGFESGLSQSIACTDTWIQVWDPSAEIALELYVPGIVAEAGTATASRSIDLSNRGSTTLAAVAATPIAENYCTDALVPRDVHERWNATSGTLTVTVDASQVGSNPVASITLADVVFSLDGASITVGAASWADIAVVTMWGG